MSSAGGGRKVAEAYPSATGRCGRGPHGQHSGAVHPARMLWQLAEPWHAIVYFAPQAHAAFEQAGLRGFWRGYFAGRAAPLGAVGSGVVTACFFGFEPGFVARAVPAVWSMTSPADALAARSAGVAAAVRALADGAVSGAEMTRAAALVRDAVADCPRAGRPLFAANLELEWPAEPHLALWHAATLLREHRGDGHVATLVGAGLDACEAHVSRVVATGVPPDTIQPYRGWTEDDWAAAVRRLQERGWIDERGVVTSAGREGRDAIERRTDELAGEPVRRLGPEGIDRVTAALGPLAAALGRSGTIPYPNPMGVPPPERGTGGTT